MPRVSLTLEQKLRVQEYYKQHSKLTYEDLRKWILVEFDVVVGRSTVGRVLSADLENWNPSSKRRRRAKFPDLDRLLFQHVQELTQRGSISDAIIHEKAKELRAELGISESDLKLSNGWICAFKSRKGIKLRNPEQKPRTDVLDRDQKLLIRKHHKRNPQMTYDALRKWAKAELNLNVTRTVIEKILQSQSLDNRKNWVKDQRRELDRQLVAFMVDYHKIGAVTDAIILDKARRIQKDLKLTDEDVSITQLWVHRFKRKYRRRKRSESKTTDVMDGDESGSDVRRDLATILGHGEPDLARQTTKQQWDSRKRSKYLSEDVDDGFYSLQREISSNEDLREIVNNNSRVIQMLSQQCIYALQRERRDKAKIAIAEATQLLQELKFNIIKKPTLFLEAYQVAKREYGGAMIFKHFLEYGELLPRSEMSIVDAEDYFQGLIIFAEQATSFAMRQGALRNVSVVQAIRDMLDTIFAQMLEFDSKIVSQQVDAMKSNLDQVEKILFEMNQCIEDRVLANTKIQV